MTHPLARARERIAAPERWTQGEMARDRNGKPIHENDSKAVCWCLGGALWAETNNARLVAAAVNILGKLVPKFHFAEFNDTHTHAEVIALLDRALTATGDEQHG